MCIRCTTLYTLWYLNLYLVSSFSPQSGMSLEMMCYKLPISMTILPTVTINYRLVMVLTRSWMNSSSPNLAYFLNYFLPLLLLAWFMAESAIFLIFHCFIAHSHHAYYICKSLCDIHYLYHECWMRLFIHNYWHLYVVTGKLWFSPSLLSTNLLGYKWCPEQAFLISVLYTPWVSPGVSILCFSSCFNLFFILFFIFFCICVTSCET